MSQDGNDLGRQLARGDQDAYRTLYERFGGAMFCLAMRILANVPEAEDAVQETFASLVRSQARLADVQDLQAYLFSSLRREAWRIAQKRRRNTGPALTESMAGMQAADGQSGGRAFEFSGQAEIAAAAEKALAKLPSEQREVLSLKIDGELTFEQIGQVLGVSPNTAASRYRYALARLRQMLVNYE